MTREEFIRILKEKRYYKIEGDRIVVTRKGDVFLPILTSLPPGVEFKNEGGVFLPSLTSLPSGVVFSNEGSVRLNVLTSISPGTEFKNLGYVDLYALIGGWFEEWKGNIEGIGSKRLLNFMISRKIFEK